MNDRVNFATGLEAAWTNFMLFVPKLLMFVLILVAGYFIAKLGCKLLARLLQKLRFDHLVERGGVKAALRNSGYEASDVLAQILFYFIFLIALEVAFGVFGPNPVSDLLTRIVAFLPNIFVAVVIVIVAAWIAKAVRDIIRISLARLSYGRWLANISAAAIWMVGVFAALNQLSIAPAIINGLFYAVLAVVVGSAIVAIGGGGIVPMRAQWEKALGRLEHEAPRIRAEAENAAPHIEAWREPAEPPPGDSEHRPWAANQ